MRDIAAMPAKVEAFLSEATGRRAEVTNYELMTGGYSRVMARVDLRWEDGAEETFVLRGDPPPEEALLHTDRDHEWAVLRGLTEIDQIPMPAARYYDATGTHFGTKAIFLDHVTAPSLQGRFDTGLDPAANVIGLADAAASIARIGPDQLPVEIERPTDWDSYLDGVIDLWADIDRAYPGALPIYRYVAAWLKANKPPEMPLRLSHGDFQCANILAADDGWQIIDWEYAHIGDPREDLGWHNGYHAAAPPNCYALDPEGFLARYRQQTGFTEEQVNQLTVGYFTIVATVKVIAGIATALGGFAAGQAQGATISFNYLSLTFSHFNFLNAIAGIEAAIAQLEGA
ncbi:MAG: phosphotransferase family protein [Actinomycetota bacterium]